MEVSAAPAPVAEAAPVVQAQEATPPEIVVDAAGDVAKGDDVEAAHESSEQVGVTEEAAEDDAAQAHL